MKKILLIAWIILSGTAMFAQIDSASIINTLRTTGVIVNTIHPTNWIPNVPNDVTSGIIGAVASLIIALIHKVKTLKKWRKQGKLND